MIDGKYQCNRICGNIPGRDNCDDIPPYLTIDLEAYGAEKFYADGRITHQPWTFRKSGRERSDTSSSHRRGAFFKDESGTIKVIVLRCKRNENTRIPLFQDPPFLNKKAAKGSKDHEGFKDEPRHRKNSSFERRCPPDIRGTSGSRSFIAPNPQKDPPLFPKDSSPPYGGLWNPNHFSKWTKSPSVEEPASSAENGPSRNKGAFNKAHSYETRAGTCQVQLGKALPYVQKTLSPQYLDTIEQPYMTFTFKYRGQGRRTKP